MIGRFLKSYSIKRQLYFDTLSQSFFAFSKKKNKQTILLIIQQIPLSDKFNNKGVKNYFRNIYD